MTLKLEDEEDLSRLLYRIKTPTNISNSNNNNNITSNGLNNNSNGLNNGLNNNNNINSSISYNSNASSILSADNTFSLSTLSINPMISPILRRASTSSIHNMHNNSTINASNINALNVNNPYISSSNSSSKLSPKLSSTSNFTFPMSNPPVYHNNNINNINISNSSRTYFQNLANAYAKPVKTNLNTPSVTEKLSISRINLPVKSGIECIHLPPMNHIHGINTRDVLYKRENNVPKDVYQTKMQRHDRSRLMYPERVFNKIVYDSFDPSPASIKSKSDIDDEKSNPLTNTNAEIASNSSLLSSNPFINNTHLTISPSPIISPITNTPIEEPYVPQVPDTITRANFLSIPPATAFKIKIMTGNVPIRGIEESVDDLKPYYILNNEDDRTLLFESRFECGNLRRAIRIFDNEYDLSIRPDINTKRHTQWFYFRVRNARPGLIYKFNIINLTKLDSLYNYGMQPLIYSEKEASLTNTGWTHCGNEISYYQNNNRRGKRRYYYSVTFSFKAQHANDTLYFAYCYPYSYTDLQIDLEQLENHPEKKKHFRRRNLCYTLAGNGCDLLTITDFSDADTFEGMEKMKSRKGVVISSRVHPGESNASWIMKGIIDTLVGDSEVAQKLRSKLIFKIVPMLNPDGVITGNYRCSLAGVDLNRQWQFPSKRIMPTIWNTKEMIRRFQEDREVLLLCDIHGHSKASNLFIYGCDDLSPDNPNRILSRVFPHIFGKLCSNFSFKDCNFVVQKSKAGSARVASFNEFGIMNAYTMESSFAGPNRGPSAGTHFTISDYAEMGKKFCEALLELIDDNKTSFNASLAELTALYGDKKKDEAESDQGSEFGGDEVDEAEQDSCLFNEIDPTATPTGPVDDEDIDAKSEGTQEKEKIDLPQPKEKSEKRASSKKKAMPAGLSSAVAGAFSQREVESEFETLFKSEAVRLAPDFREIAPKKTKIIDMSLHFSPSISARPPSTEPISTPNSHKNHNDSLELETIRRKANTLSTDVVKPIASLAPLSLNFPISFSFIKKVDAPLLFNRSATSANNNSELSTATNIASNTKAPSPKLKHNRSASVSLVNSGLPLNSVLSAATKETRPPNTARVALKTRVDPLAVKPKSVKKV